MTKEPDEATAVERLRALWDEFSEVPVDNNDGIERPFHGFERGTDRMDIWKWFDEKCPNGLVKDILGKAGTYGKRSTFEDARTTVTEFLDDFYDDSEENFNQAFLNLERRLQEYFRYEPRDTENDRQTGSEYVVYMDGAEWARSPDRQDAEAIARSYRGEHDVWIERRDNDE